MPFIKKHSVLSSDFTFPNLRIDEEIDESSDYSGKWSVFLNQV